MVKCLPAVWETRVQSLGWEDPLEKEMATHSSKRLGIEQDICQETMKLDDSGYNKMNKYYSGKNIFAEI